jgi:hypothetical protein
VALALFGCHRTNEPAPPTLVSEPACQLQAEAGEVFFRNTESSRLRRVSRSGVSVVEGIPSERVEHYVVDESHVYYTAPSEKALKRVPRAGGATTMVLRLALELTALTADDRYLYFSATPGIERVAKEGGAPTSVLERDSSGLVVDADYVYTFIGDELVKVRKFGGNPTVLFNVTELRQRATKTGGDWIDSTRSELVEKGDFVYGRSMRCGVYGIPKAGGDPVFLVRSKLECIKGNHLSVGDTVVFETDDGHAPRLFEVPLGGGEPKQIAVANRGTICSLAHDDKTVLAGVLLGGDQGVVWKLAR